MVTRVNISGLKKPAVDFLPLLAALNDPQFDRLELEPLDLSGNLVGDGDLASLERLIRLTDLSLANTQVTDDGLAHLKALTGLRRLVLDGCPIKGSGLDHLKNLSKLTQLRLGCSQP